MGRQSAQGAGWLYQVPPWRAPRLWQRHHYGLIDGFFYLMGLSLYGLFFLDVWMLEACLWLAVWYYYGLFLGARWVVRWIWRRNPIGQTIDSRAARHDRQQAVPRSRRHTQSEPIDLGRLGTRTRGHDQ